LKSRSKSPHLRRRRHSPASGGSGSSDAIDLESQSEFVEELHQYQQDLAVKVTQATSLIADTHSSLQRIKQTLEEVSLPSLSSSRNQSKLGINLKKSQSSSSSPTSELIDGDDGDWETLLAAFAGSSAFTSHHLSSSASSSSSSSSLPSSQSSTIHSFGQLLRRVMDQTIQTHRSIAQLKAQREHLNELADRRRNIEERQQQREADLEAEVFITRFRFGFRSGGSFKFFSHLHSKSFSCVVSLSARKSCSCRGCHSIGCCLSNPHFRQCYGVVGTSAIQLSLVRNRCSLFVRFVLFLPPSRQSSSISSSS
jgi:hypothetical protein